MARSCCQSGPATHDGVHGDDLWGGKEDYRGNTEQFEGSAGELTGQRAEGRVEGLLGQKNLASDNASLPHSLVAFAASRLG
jgi:hypothetical protein